MFKIRSTFTMAAAASLAIVVSFSANGQEAPAKRVPPCERDAHFHDFDFWIGTWDVSAIANGQHAGRNTISRIERGCVLEEKWQGQQGGTGTSLNFYTPNTGKWRQVWVSNGYNIDIEGGLNDEGAMALEGTIYYYNGTQFPFRGTWTPMPEGWVRQYFQQFDAEKDSWADWFDGKYVRVDAE